MLILISPAKSFSASPQTLYRPSQQSASTFAQESWEIARGAVALPPEILAEALSLSPTLLGKARRAWQDFMQESPGLMGTALGMYSGMVFKKLDAQTLSEDSLAFASEHLLICSFVYGLLRPEHQIRPYRMEGSARLQLEGEEQRVFDYWRGKLTPFLIERGRTEGEGRLIFLASEEMKQLFHWEQVEEALEVITPTFMVRDARSGKLRQKTIYTKMARGVMLSEILRRQILDPALLQSISPEGFVYDASLSDEKQWLYVMDDI